MRLGRCSLVIFALLALPALLGACDVSPRPESRACPSFEGSPGDRGVVVVSSDLVASTVVSLVSWDGTIVTPSVWSSGRRSPGLAAALSGDVIAAWTPDPSGDVLLADRRSGVLSWIAPTTCDLVREVPAGDFDANPHDLVPDGAGGTFVLRYNPSPDGARGGDLWVLGADRRTVRGRVDLTPFLADVPGALTRPDRALLVDDRLFVVLQGFSADYTDAADATVVEIDAKSLAPRGKVRFQGVKNCGAMVRWGERALVLSCSGLHTEALSAPQKLAGSALVVLNLDNDKMAPGRIVPAALLGGQQLGTALAALPSGRILVSVYGERAGAAPDRWITLSLSEDDPGLAEVHRAPYLALGEVLCRGATCWGADASGKGALRRLEERDGVVSLASALTLDPLLPPRTLGRF